MGVSEKRQNFHFGVEYPFNTMFKHNMLQTHAEVLWENNELLVRRFLFNMNQVCIIMVKWLIANILLKNIITTIVFFSFLHFIRIIALSFSTNQENVNSYYFLADLVAANSTNGRVKENTTFI